MQVQSLGQEDVLEKEIVAVSCASLVAQLVRNPPAGDPSSILELGRCPGEGKGYSLQFSWASLVAQMVKNLPQVWEMLV